MFGGTWRCFEPDHSTDWLADIYLKKKKTLEVPKMTHEINHQEYMISDLSTEF